MAVDEKRVRDRREETVIPSRVLDPDAEGGEDAGVAAGLDDRIDSADREPGRSPRTARQRVFAGFAAVLAVALIVFSAVHVFDAPDGARVESLLQTTGDSLQEGDLAQREGLAEDEGEGKSPAADGEDLPDDEGEIEEPDDALAVPSGDESSGDASSDSSRDQGSAGAGGPDGSSASGGSSESDGGSSQESKPQYVTVSVSVTSAAADGSVSGGANPTFAYGATAYDALRATGLAFASRGAYISSIGGLQERDPRFGTGSGWMYSVNGAIPSVPCTDYVLRDGDAVQWFYVVG